MSKITFNKKPRKDSPFSGYVTDGKGVFIGKDLALQGDIDDAKARTRARACFRECRTCGACSASQRDATYPKAYDAYARKMIDCRGCEPFRYHDCHNGWMRDSHQEAEPFTPDVIKLLQESGGKPLI